MNEFLELIEFQSIEFTLDVILNRFHIMVRCFLDILDFLCVEFREVFIDLPDLDQLVDRKIFQFLNRGRHINEILNLDLKAVFDQTSFRKIRRQGFYSFKVSAVDGRDGSKWI